MRIGIDASPFKFQNRRGVANYLYQIIKVWIEQYTQHEYYLIASEPIFLDLDLPANWHIITEQKKKCNSVIWNCCRLPGIIRKLRIDVFWGPDFILPPKVKGVDYYVTVHDLAFTMFWYSIPLKLLLKLLGLCKASCKRAEKVIAVSQSTKDDIIRIYRIPAKNIIVSYEGGVEKKNEISYDETNIRSDLKLQNVFLFVSGFEPRKNINTIIKAFEVYKRKYGGDEKLILAGNHDYKTKSIFRCINHSDYKESIIAPGYINSDEKAYLFTNSICLLYPSLYEGFGIPILEGFDYGLPVITSEVSSMPEVGGNAAFYIKNPLDKKELAIAMHKVRHMDEKQLERCRENMTIQAKKFSWEKNAAEIMGVLKKG